MAVKTNIKLLFYSGLIFGEPIKQVLLACYLPEFLLWPKLRPISYSLFTAFVGIMVFVGSGDSDC